MESYTIWTDQFNLKILSVHWYPSGRTLRSLKKAIGKKLHGAVGIAPGLLEMRQAIQNHLHPKRLLF
jgi:hypothetical protein